MRKVLLDLDPARSVEWIHQYLKGELGFEDYYGCNLDALYDSLTDLTEDTCLGIFCPQKDDSGLSSYISRVRKVMRDAERDNPHLCVIFGDREENDEEGREHGS